jgi:hypothetical protein
VPTEVSLEHAKSSARFAAVEMLASLRSVLGDLDRVVSWLTVVSFVNADPNYASIDLAMNPVSDLMLALYGPEMGMIAGQSPSRRLHSTCRSPSWLRSRSGTDRGAVLTSDGPRRQRSGQGSVEGRRCAQVHATHSLSTFYVD